jgi:hypothetical protein
MLNGSSSAATDVDFARVGSRIVGALQPSAARAETSQGVANEERLRLDLREPSYVRSHI